MGFLDRGFERALELQPGEAIRWQGSATHRVRRTWVGGRIYVSDARLFFCPGVLSRGRYETVRLPLAAIVAVEVLRRSGSVSAGGLRRRLRIRTGSGEEHTFSLPGFNRRAPKLQALISEGGSGRTP